MRQILASSACPRCGLQNPTGSISCHGCGLQFLQAPATPGGTAPQTGTPPASQGIAGGSRNVAKSPAAPSAWGSSSVSGTVVFVDSSQLVKPTFQLAPFLAKLCAIIASVAIFGVVALFVVLAVALVSAVFSRAVSPRTARSGPGFFKSVLTQVVGFFLTSRLLTPPAMVPLISVRIRDQSGTEHLARIEGYIRTGGFNVGDDVTVEGRNRAGTLDVRRGWNNRIRSEIRIRRK